MTAPPAGLTRPPSLAVRWFWRPVAFVAAAPFVVAALTVVVALAPAFVVVSFVASWWLDRREWHRFRRVGRAATWADAERALASGTGTLVVECYEFGEAVRAWLVDRPTTALDRGAAAPGWSEFVTGLFDETVPEPDGPPPAWFDPDAWAARRVRGVPWRRLYRTPGAYPPRAVLVTAPRRRPRPGP